MSKEKHVQHGGPTIGMISIRDLAPLSGHRIALILNRRGKPAVFRSTGHYEQDPTLGPVLRLRLDGSLHEGETDVLICENEWEGRIAAGAQYGCGFSLIPAPKRRGKQIEPQS